MRNPFFCISIDQETLRWQPIFFELACLDVLANQLLVLRIDAVAILFERDQVDLEDRVGLFDVRLGLQIPDLLSRQFVDVSCTVELGDDVARLDA